MKHCPRCNIMYEAVFCPLCEAEREIEDLKEKVKKAAPE